MPRTIKVSNSSSQESNTQQRKKFWALLVGVSQYQDEQINNLSYSALDCQELAKALQAATEQFTFTEIRTYHDFTQQKPDLEIVRANLAEIIANAEPEDTVLFYFAGHGILLENTNQAFLCVSDTHKDNLQNTALNLQELLQQFDSCRASEQLMWLDACHSGGMTLRGTTVEQFKQRAAQIKGKSKSFYAILSCEVNQLSWEFDELGHGIFTYYLISGLKGEAADPKGIISVDGLYRYVYHQTLKYVDEINQQQRLRYEEPKLLKLQTPKRIVEGVGEIILGSMSTFVASHPQRIALLVERCSGNQKTLDFSKLLYERGSFKLIYLPRQSTKTAKEVRKEIQQCLRVSNQQQPRSEEPVTVLLYLHGQLSETTTGEVALVLSEDIWLSGSWLGKQLRRSEIRQQIIILDYSTVENSPGKYLQEWVENLQIDSENSLGKVQYIIAAASPHNNSEQFTQALIDTFNAASDSNSLSVATWIKKLRYHLTGSLKVEHSLSGMGVIDVIPASSGTNKPGALDLGICPYKGLEAFKEEDYQYFYGRESLTQQLMNHLAQKSFLAVVGASGSGKSSVVQAGLIAQLRFGKQLPGSEKWSIKSLRPGASPLKALSQALAEKKPGAAVLKKSRQSLEAAGISDSFNSRAFLSSENSEYFVIEGLLYQGVEGFVYWVRSRPEPIVVLVIDQFEELFTQASAADRERFLEMVLGAVEYAGDKFKLVITVRADFITFCLEVPLLARSLQQSNVLVPPNLSNDDYRSVIVKPAEQVGLKVEQALEEVLLQELSHSVGDLPVLEFVLQQLWKFREEGELTLATYKHKIGGIQGALERKAEEVYKSLDPQAQECVLWILMSLTQLGEGTEEYTKRRVLKSELIVNKYSAELVERTLQALIAAKLVVVNLEATESHEVSQANRGSRGGEEKDTENLFVPSSQAVTIEIAHEILIRYWSTLRWWLDANRDRLRKQRQITHACQAWQQSGKQTDFLLQGVRLAEAEEIYLQWTDELAADVQEFIEACLAERKRQQMQEKNRLKQAQRAVVALSVLGIASMSFGGLAYWQARSARLREIEALNSSSSANLLSNQQLEALIASVKAGKQLKNTLGAPVEMQTQTLSVLQKVISGTQERNRLEGHSAEVLSVSFSPDGKTIVSASNDKTAILWGRDGTKLRILTGHTGIVRSVSFSPDGQMIATASFDRTVRLWRTSDGGLIRTLNGHTAEVLSLSWSSNGQMIATGSADRTAKIWQVSDGHLLRTFRGYKDFVNSVSFSPDSEILAIASADKTVKLWSVSDGLLQKTLKGHSAGVSSVAFSPDGQTLASASEDKSVRLWRRDGSLLKIIAAHNAGVFSVNFSHDGQTLASTGADRTIKLWNFQDGSLRQTLLGHSIAVYSVSFSPDDQILVSSGADKTVRLWQRENPLFKTLTGSQGQLYSVSFSPDGQTLATAGQDTTIKLWRRDGTLRQTLEGYRTSVYGHSDAIFGLAFSPDGETLASASQDHYIKLWRTHDGYMIKTLQGHGRNVNSLSFSPNSQILASASADTTINLWNIHKKALIKTLQGHSAEVLSVRFSPDGQVLASAGRDNTVKLWRVKDGKLLYSISEHINAVNAISFSHDGELLASASADKTIKLWQISNTALQQTLVGHTDGVYSVSFSPDGKIIASASSDGSIKLWSRDGRELKTILGHTDLVLSVGFSPDGKFLASASFDGTAKLWRLSGTELQTQDLDNLLIRSCHLLKDYLKTNPNISDQERGSLCSDLRG